MPAAIPIAAAAIGVGANIAGAASGVGKTDMRAGGFDQTKAYDPNRFEYGGVAGGANAAADRYRWGADHAQTRRGEQVDYTQATQDRYLQLQAREGEKALARAMQARAMGQVPSIAQMQADRQMQQAIAAQASQAASARGAAGLALAGQNAAANTAMLQSGISNQAQINAAQERMQAEQAAFGAYGQMRGTDLASQQQAAAMAQYQAQINAAQRAQNDQFSMGFTQAEQNVRSRQLDSNLSQQGLLGTSYGNADRLNMGAEQGNAATDMRFFQGATGAVTDVMASGYGGGGGSAPKK